MGLLKKIDFLTEKILWKKNEKMFNKIEKGYCFGYNFYVNNPKYVSIGKNFWAGENVKIEVWPFYSGKDTGYNPNVIIGDDVFITDNSYISCLNEIHIGDGVLIGPNTFITDNFHGDSRKLEANVKPIDRKLYTKGRVVIGDNVWIGRNVCIMPNVIIGKGSIIGANSVVTHDVKENSIMVGCPARNIK